MEAKRFILKKYEPAHFEEDWSKVGIFEIAGMQQDDRMAEVDREDICGKGVVNGTTMVLYTRDMWLV